MDDRDKDFFLKKLEEWLAAEGDGATGLDIIRAGDFEVLAGYVIHVVGSARLDVPIGPFPQRRAIALGATAAANPAMRVFAGLAHAWNLSPEEAVALLDVSSCAELATLEQSVMEKVPATIIERLVILLDIFKALNTLLPAPAHADGWIRRPSTASLFASRTPLRVMMESPDGIRRVQRYLNAEVWSG